MENKIIPIRLIDRTRTVADWKCPRARYWGYEYLGKGITKTSTSLELFIGIILHDALAALATFTKDGKEIPIDDIASAAYQQIYDELIELAGDVIQQENIDFAKEQATLVEGIIRGLHKHLWPRLMAHYPRIIAIEQEMEYKLAEDLIFMAKPDLIVEDQEGELVYLEYKSTSSKKESWVNSWDTAVQLHSSIKATEQTLGRPVGYVQIVGMYKGYESYGKQSSPFCYAYMKKGNPPFTEDIVQYEFKAGFKRYPTWELPGGVKGWVEDMPDNVLATQFPLTAPITVNDDLVKAFFDQRLIRENEISDAVSGIEFEEANPSEDSDRIINHYMNMVFPQKFDQCVPSFGYSCQFKKICHGEVRDPLNEGYELRVPHHAREIEEGEIEDEG